MSVSSVGLLQLGLALLPVLTFLLILIYLDTFKLVRPRAVVLAILAGAFTALLAFWVNSFLLGWAGWDPVAFRRYMAPLLEEILKAAPLAYLVLSRRVAFPVDAAIFGFAIGAGFAVVENVYYLQVLPDASMAVWAVRGFGTGIMHGGMTAIVGILASIFVERTHNVWIFFPGLTVAFLLHSFFNHFWISPLLSTAAILLLIPPATLLTFQKSEDFLRSWLGSGFDAEAELMAELKSGEFSGSRIGEFLESLSRTFPSHIVADMLCYLRIRTELALRAKGLLMIKEQGLSAGADEMARKQLAELSYLEESIGPAGLRALAPVLHTSRKDLWQLYLLEE